MFIRADTGENKKGRRLMAPGVLRGIGFLVPYSAPGYEIQGREAVAYLTFIVDYYESLPDYSVFIHANENQWHNDFFGGKTNKTLNNFRYQVADSQGYVNLRCSTDPGCPTSVNPRDPTLQDTRHKDVRLYLADIYMYLFQVPYESVLENIGGVCCAQFLVTREQVLWLFPNEELPEKLIKRKERLFDLAFRKFRGGSLRGKSPLEGESNAPSREAPVPACLAVCWLLRFKGRYRAFIYFHTMNEFILDKDGQLR
ncbi:hypothetical protein H112_07341 [Trichophyton rubrum D6]|uniref:Uncharacterized protein n=2 Tax=Trichophyton rubrum TaxID=5551 RepID=F2SIH2_TRIRC|nr:uncharacterized protein TERG_02660 [Trichophyton rubrum CBS 118892]EZF11528.1 hypothetical protein H100_07368 [Trichophyton rubrum MR850]EZF38452.1 hypothetical protein H102_07329 [Trichophyton rubrum CBS 100081]EZF49043.1 hypothetical protein H103_07352 [Trichophyton rubrum CBS 288.86]EZF59674.1 hypothetical protein H104_07304 [Trichophyton rubrum CBS 289.86]EZF80960.1 hypothetical protein H110_07350 [Trichophyton rubrum MR1448]EZF91637.1 hypothetical protein H113_07404 [Trichophyton rubr